jgi:adenosyl cobinamide kinase/adenosyl cobinamide phosphate guanylyltransferase
MKHAYAILVNVNSRRVHHTRQQLLHCSVSQTLSLGMKVTVELHNKITSHRHKKKKAWNITEETHCALHVLILCISKSD